MSKGSQWDSKSYVEKLSIFVVGRSCVSTAAGLWPEKQTDKGTIQLGKKPWAAGERDL